MASIILPKQESGQKHGIYRPLDQALGCPQLQSRLTPVFSLRIRSLAETDVGDPSCSMCVRDWRLEHHHYYGKLAPPSQ
jgi:hypothetical protein